jgi:glycosyltransferase involved in cell wall biosynthesis
MPDAIGRVVLPHLLRRVSPGHEIGAIAEISALYHSFRPDCVHLHTSKAALLGRLAPGLARSRIVYTMHGFDQLRVANRPFLAADKFLRRMCGAIVAVSALDEALMRKEGYRPELIPNGSVDARRLAGEDDALRSRLRELRARGLPLVLTVARDARPKRLELVRELAGLFRGRASFAWIGGAGSGPSGIGGEAGGLVSLGSVPIAASCLSEADIFMLASDHEGMPVSVVEAMSAALPCIASAVGGIPELLGGCGIVARNELGDFARGLGDLIASPALRRDLGEASRARWEELYSVRRMALAYEALYRRCAGDASGAGVAVGASDAGSPSGRGPA